MKFQVITEVPSVNDPEEARGNLASCFELWHSPQANGKFDRINPAASALTFRVPVFHVGEVLIVDNGGREIAGHGRKASKWSVTYDEFDNLDDAIARARELS